jgi:hypothetical protein
VARLMTYLGLSDDNINIHPDRGPNICDVSMRLDVTLR